MPKQIKTRQTMYINVTSRWVLATTVAMEKKKVLHIVSVCVCVCVCVCLCVCSLSYSACNAHAPYCHLWSAPLYSIFPHYILDGRIFEKKKKLLNTKCVSWFPLRILSETFLILRRSEWDMIKIVYWFSCKVPVILVRF